MPDQPSPPPNAGQLARLIRQHLTGLEVAGVEWLPLARTPLQVLPAAEPGQPATPAAETDGPAARRHELGLLAQRVATCDRCPTLASTRTQTVFGVGKFEPELCLVGEAPGRDEDQQGEPFVGAAGQLLNRILAACGMRREDVYICNVLKCRPPQNRTPLPDEIANCREHLERQLDLLRPRYICALGRTPANWLLGGSRSIGSLRGRVHSYKGIPVVCTYHPAYLLAGHRTSDEQELRQRKKMVWDDMKLLLTHMGRPVEQKPAGGEQRP